MVGWIKISREIANHWLWQDAERLKWWLDLLFLAAWEEKRQLVGKQLIVLQKGQLIASVSYLCNRWGRSRSMVDPYLNLLQSEGMIKKEVSKNVSIITISNYNKYQAVGDAYLEAGYLGFDTDDFNQSDAHIDAYLDTRGDAHTDAHLDAINKEIKEYSTSSTSRARENENAKFIEQLKNNSPIWVEQMAMRFHTPTSDILRRIDEFALDCECRGYIHRDLEDARRHYNDWLRIQLEVERKKKENETDRQRSQDKRRGTEISSTRWQDYEGEF